MDEVLAASAGRAGLFAADRAGAFSGGLAFQSSCRTDPPRPSVLSIARIQSGPQRSPACIAALCGAASNARAARTDARCVADTVRIRGRGGFAESGASGPRIHATLRPRTLRRRALRYDALAPSSRPDSRGIAGALKPDFILPRMGAAVLRPYKHQHEGSCYN